MMILLYKTSYAQTNVTISGKIVDLNGNALKTKTIALLKNETKGPLLIKETNTDSIGNFKFIFPHAIFQPGSYQILVLEQHSSKDKIYKDIIFTDTLSSYELGIIIVNKAPIALNEIQIVAAKPFLDRKLDKLVVNVENSILASGNNLNDILAKLPGIKIDQTGSITVNGKQGIQITIDGKGQYVEKEQIQVLLSTIKSESIKQLEIIANPSAKYDANQGSVINIVTKKNYAKSDVHLTYGTALYPEKSVSGLTYPNVSSGANLNYKTGNFSSNITFNISDDKQFRNNTVQNDYFPNLNSLKQDSALAIYHEKKLDTHIGLSYDINKNSFLSLDFLLIKNFQREYDNTDRINFLSTSQKADSIINSNGSYNLNHFYTYSLTVQYSLDLDTNHNKHLDFYYDLSNYHSPMINDVTYIVNKGSSSSATRFNSDHLYEVLFNSFKVDYKQNLGKFVQLSAGLKYSRINSSDTLNAYNSFGANNSSLLTSGDFKYNESILGEYVMINKKVGIFEGQFGLRSEFTNSNGFLNNETKVVNQSYNNLFPSVNLLSNINENNKLTFSFNRRIIRVSFNNLNPLLNYATPFVITKGDPSLEPQFINYFELSYQYKELYFSATYSNSRNSRLDIPILTENPSIITSVFQNIKQVKTTEVNTEYPVSITNWWSMINDASLSNNTSYLPSETLAYWSYNLSSSQHFNLTQTLSIDLSGNFNSKARNYYSIINSIYSVDIGLRKSLLAKRLELTINCSDLLGSVKFHTVSTYPTQATDFKSIKNNRFLNLTLKYNFNSGVAFGRKNNTSKGDFGEKRI